MRPGSSVCAMVLCMLALSALAGDGNRLAYLDESDPFYVSRSFPKLTTPQWFGEPGVEAVAILAIDDMREIDKWEAYLRPILDRLKKAYGHAPLSIMTVKIDPRHPHLQTWLGEGVSLEVHTYTHPCPILQKGDFAAAKATYDRCVDQMAAIPRSRPVAFRMPCCDSLNTPSPRFFAEIFNRTTPTGNFLAIDSSVSNVITANDPELPAELRTDEASRELFRRYLPPAFATTIEDYPYPYVIGRLCWEFPIVVPSDWSAQNRQQPKNPRTVGDLQRALDAAVVKQGVFTLVFHPYEWIDNKQIVELVDHAIQRHGDKLRFLNFREANERVDKNLLGGQSLRTPQGGDNGVRMIDLNQDGFVDVVIGNNERRQTRIWLNKEQKWGVRNDFPTTITATDASGASRDEGARFGVLHADGGPSVIVHTALERRGWRLRHRQVGRRPRAGHRAHARRQARARQPRWPRRRRAAARSRRRRHLRAGRGPS